MEVNVDVLEQMDLMDISDQEALDVFLNSGSGADEGVPTSPIPGESTCVRVFKTHTHAHTHTTLGVSRDATREIRLS